MQEAINKNQSIDLIYINYVKSIFDIDNDIKILEDVLRKKFNIITIVDNSFNLLNNSERYNIILGDNRHNEFSALLVGLKYQHCIKKKSINTLIINDTFNRNWSFSYLSKNIFRRLERKSKNNFISLSVDNSIILKKISFKAYYNSRFLFFNNIFLKTLEESLEQAIKDMNFKLKNNIPLHDELAFKQIEKFFKKNPKRFYKEKLKSIFLERNFLNTVKKNNIYVLPKNTASRLIYAIYKEITNEKR